MPIRPAIIRLEIPRVWIILIALFQNPGNIPRIMVIENAHELAEINVGNTSITPDNEHVFIINSL